MEQKQSSHHSLVYYLLMLIILWKWRWKKSVKNFEINSINAHISLFVRFFITVYYNSIISRTTFHEQTEKKPSCLSRHKTKTKTRQSDGGNLWFERIIITNIGYGVLVNHSDRESFCQVCLWICSWPSVGTIFLFENNETGWMVINRPINRYFSRFFSHSKNLCGMFNVFDVNSLEIEWLPNKINSNLVWNWRFYGTKIWFWSQWLPTIRLT